MHANPQYIVLFHHFRRFLQIARQQALDVAPLKGAHLLTHVYPEGEDRGKISDVDFLVRADDFDRACALIGQLGFERQVLPRSAVHAPQHEAAFVLRLGEGKEILFEMHRYLVDQRRFPIDHRPIWERSVPSEFDGVPCRRLSPEDHFCHLALHETLHCLITVDRTLRDLALLALSGELDLARTIDLAYQWRITRILWFFILMVDRQHPRLGLPEWAQGLAPPEPVQSVLRLIMSGHAARLLGNRSHRAKAALLWPWMIDSPKQLLRLVLNHPDLKLS